MAEAVLPPADEEDEIQLKSLEPVKSNRFCFLCEYGFSTGTHAKQLIAQLQVIIDESIGKRSLSDVSEDVVEYYNENIRAHIDDNPAWTRQSVEEHILQHNASNMDVASELDKRSVCQILQRLRDKMVDEQDNLYMPNVTTYLKFSQHLQRLNGTKPPGAR